MGRPINKKYIGVPGGDYNQLIVSEAWIPGASGPSGNDSTWIINQRGTGRYMVSDGDYTGVVKLQADALTGPGQARIYVVPFLAGEAAATADATMKVNGASVATAGAGYTDGLYSFCPVVGGTAVNGNVATLNITISGGEATTITIGNPGEYSVLPTGPFQVTFPSIAGSPTTNATFTATYDVANVNIINGGGAYSSTPSIQFDLPEYGNPPSTTVTITNGVITAIAIVDGPAVYNVIPNIYIAGPVAPTEYARVIYDRSVKTFADNDYKWTVQNASVAGYATLPIAEYVY